MAIRVIPCLDVKDGRVVKGVNFVGLRDAGDPVELAAEYGRLGADEVTFLDISASTEGRATTREMVTRCAETVFVPLTVGGGVRGVDDVDVLLRAGADKVGVNTAAIAHPGMIDEVADRFGNQVIVLSVDARREPDRPSGFGVTTHGGTRSAGLDAVEWACQAVERGAGEIPVSYTHLTLPTSPSSLQVELERLPISSRRRAPELTRCSPRQFFTITP